jgi:hypothetical protein
MTLTSNTATASKLPTGNSRTTNNPLRRANGNTAQGRRVRDLYRGYMAVLGSPGDPATAALVLAAAELVVSAEKARADLLAGQGDLNSVIRIENLSNRALKRLNLNKPVPKPAGPTLQDITAKYSSPRGAQNGPEVHETTPAEQRTSGPAGSPSRAAL